MIVTTEAVVLKTMKYRESSRILTLYTREFGKLSVIAKGARERKSKFGSALEPMSYVNAVLYKKDTRELQLLSQCDVVKPLQHLSEDMERMAAGMGVVELVDAVSHAEEENKPLFALLLNTLNAINNATKNALNALYYFEIRLLDIMGFRPNINACFNCGASFEERATGPGVLELHVSYGGVLCAACSSKGMGLAAISAGTVKVLQRLQEVSDVEAVTRIKMSPQMKNEVRRTLRHYLQTHVEGLRTLKSEAVFSSIM